MDPLILFTILGSVAGILFGVVVGLFIAKPGKKRKKDAEVSTPSEQSAVDAEHKLSSMDPQAALTNRAYDGHQPLLCLWRGRESGNLAIEIKGKLYPTSEVFNENVKNHLVKLGEEWLDWLGVSPEPEDKRIRTETTVSERAVASPIVKESEPVLPVHAASPPLTTTVQEVPAITSPDELRSKTMVEQIDEILQAKLAKSSHANRAIRIIEDPTKGVVVLIGLTLYNGINEVDDPEVLKIIHAAVSEWEALTGGKRR